MILVVLLFSLLVDKVTSKCPTTSNIIQTSDIQHAAMASSRIYNDPQPGTYIKGTNFKVIKSFYGLVMSNGEGIRTIVADDGNKRMIAYRGSAGIAQVVRQGLDSLFLQTHKTVIDGKTIHIMKYFMQASDISFNDLKIYLKDPTKQYILTGHSLGGALASVLALRMTQHFEGSIWKNTRSSLITFGQPRVGDRSFAELHDTLIPAFRKIRFIYKSDPITNFPSIDIFNPSHWVHHSNAVFLGTKYMFLLGSITIMKICRKRVGRRCYKQQFWNIEDHSIEYYLKSVMKMPKVLILSRQNNWASTFQHAWLDVCEKK